MKVILIAHSLSGFFRFTVRSDPRWCCTYLLDATDPLFIEIGKTFIRQQLEGTESGNKLTPAMLHVMFFAKGGYLFSSQIFIKLLEYVICISRLLFNERVSYWYLHILSFIQNMEGLATSIIGESDSFFIFLYMHVISFFSWNKEFLWYLCYFCMQNHWM